MKGMLALAALLGVLSVCRVQVRIHSFLTSRNPLFSPNCAAGTRIPVRHRRRLGSTRSLARSLSCGALTLEIRQMSGAAKRTTAIDVGVCCRFFCEITRTVFPSSPKLRTEMRTYRDSGYGGCQTQIRSMTVMPHAPIAFLLRLTAFLSWTRYRKTQDK